MHLATSIASIRCPKAKNTAAALGLLDITSRDFLVTVQYATRTARRTPDAKQTSLPSITSKQEYDAHICIRSCSVCTCCLIDKACPCLSRDVVRGEMGRGGASNGFVNQTTFLCSKHLFHAAHRLQPLYFIASAILPMRVLACRESLCSSSYCSSSTSTVQAPAREFLGLLSTRMVN
jgi:hypothetical protein